MTPPDMNHDNNHHIFFFTKRKWSLIYSVLILLLAGPLAGQEAFRRHFIIAYDISGPFIRAEKSCFDYQNSLLKLFSNETPSNYKEAYADNLNIERENGLLFFDKNQDEISFFHFNVARQEFEELRAVSAQKNENEIINSFTNCFLKDKNFNWTSYSQSNDNIKDYLNATLEIKPTPAYFGGGVSMSNFVYPLILDKIDTTKYASEYILIILSDFLTGSMLGNTKDLDRVRDIYSVPYNTTLPKNSPVSFIKKRIDFLASQYYKIDFFQYSFTQSYNNDMLGIISYKIKPKVGVLTPEDVSLFIDGNLSLKQRGYKSSHFRTSETKIKFTHNKNLTPLEVKMTIFSDNGEYDEPLFEDVIAAHTHTENWVSNYTKNKQLMKFDPTSLTYTLPPLTITMDSAINKKEFSNLLIQYQLKTKYETSSETQPLNFIYQTERELPIKNIKYSTKATIIIMYYLIPILIILLLIFVIINYGKPRKLKLNLEGYLDSYQKIDYKTVGKFLTPYKPWNYKKQEGLDFLLATGKVSYKSENSPFNWKTTVYLNLTADVLPEGFDIFLKHSTEDIKEFAPEHPMAVQTDKKGNFSFIIGIRQVNIMKEITEPEAIRLSIEGAINKSVLLIRAEERDVLPYYFHIGQDLEDVWVGFDPGTSGSCIAVGSSAENILLGKDEVNTHIIPSILAFDKGEDYTSHSGEIPSHLYKHGTVAQALHRSRKKYTSFQSIKKLLGFKDIKTIYFDNGKTLSLNGKELASLLVKGLFEDITKFFKRPELKSDDYKRNGLFNPLRAVVAIPNNFTCSKIQDMVDCIEALGQFKEIRYVYEAEAVLFYYLSKYSRFNPANKQFTFETILIFDMGGATINATIVTTHKKEKDNRSKYIIDLLGKIGYGIGGDTIDYCISKFILSFADTYPELKTVNLIDQKAELAELAFQIKKEIIPNYNNALPYLITAYNLQVFIQQGLGIAINITENSEIYKYFAKTQQGTYPLFSHPLFKKHIYDNVRDAINDLTDISGNILIDKIIFSGRSTAFPMIKETAEKMLKPENENIKTISLNLEESKTAVATGACWYGINKNSIELNNVRTNASFGFKKTLSADQADIEFHELIPMGYTFETNGAGTNLLQRTEYVNDNFPFDGNKVHFYQIMGIEPDKILAEEQKHKYSKITTIPLEQAALNIGMQINNTEEIECRVQLQSNRILSATGVVVDQEIEDANAEHYTWILK